MLVGKNIQSKAARKMAAHVSGGDPLTPYSLVLPGTYSTLYCFTHLSFNFKPLAVYYVFYYLLDQQSDLIRSLSQT